MAIEDQNEVGIDLITDGEERRGHYVLYVLLPHTAAREKLANLAEAAALLNRAEI